MTQTLSNFITSEHKEQYLEEGYMILENVMSDEQLQILRDSCDYLIDAMHAEMDKQGTDHIHISIRGKRYHIAKQYEKAPRLKEYILELRKKTKKSALLSCTGNLEKSTLKFTNEPSEKF